MKLYPCPHCGKKVTINRMRDDDGYWFYVHGVQRSDVYCHCRVFMESERFSDSTPDEEIKEIHRELVDKWNRRKYYVAD